VGRFIDCVRRLERPPYAGFGRFLCRHLKLAESLPIVSP
jgi:hypothetical protein